MLLTNEIQHGEAALAGFGREAETPAQLLQEHHSALGGPQQQHRVDRGDVEPFVEQVDREQDLQFAVLQAAQGVAALIGGVAVAALELEGLAGPGERADDGDLDLTSED